MSDDCVTNRGGASPGFIRASGQDPRQQARTTPRRKTDSSLRVQVRQKAREVDSSRMVWNTTCFLRDAHKPTGERRISGQPRASRVLLGGRRTHYTHTNEYDTTRGGSIDA